MTSSTAAKNAAADSRIDYSKIPGLRQNPLLRLLPYMILIAAAALAPTVLFKLRPDTGNYYVSVLVIVGINAILAVGLNLLMGYAGQVSLGHAAFYGIGAYVSAILTTQGVPQEIIPPVAAVIAIMAATACVIALIRLESYKLALATGGFILIALLALHFGAGHWITVTAAFVSIGVIPIICRTSVAKVAMSYVVGAAVGWGALTLLNHTLASGGISPWYAMIAGVAFSCLVAYLIGGQTLRLQGHYLAMATLGFGFIVAIALLHWEVVTGGTSGIYGIPALKAFGKTLDNSVRQYYLVWAIVIVVVALSANIVNSRVGRAFRAVHGSELAASSLGVDTGLYKVQVFVLSAAMASIAGSLYAHVVTFISPEPFGFKFSIELVVMVVVGGMASIWGAIFGAGLITILGEVLRGLGEVTLGKMTVSLSDLDVVIFGIILMLIMIFIPDGLVRGAVDGVRLFTSAIRRKGKTASKNP